MSKVAPAPKLPPSDLTQFPTLSGKKNKKSSVTVPVSGTWTPVTSKNSNNTNNNKSKTNDLCSSSKTQQDNKNKNKQKKKNGNNNNNNNNINVIENNGTTTNDLEIVKKRSELKIGSLSLGENTSNAPPGFPKKPPPGFTNFNNQNFPSLSNDLTFTSSSGQSYSINQFNYHQPSNFAVRNQNLIKKAVGILSKETMNEFKSYSMLFRDGTLPAERYFLYCKEILGESFMDLFTELLVLLPDIEKQNQLYRVCDSYVKRNLVVCETCKQVVFRKELGEHYNYHSLDSQFPSLGKSSENSNVWKK